MSGLRRELDRLTIEELVRFVVTDEELPAALALVRRFGDQHLAAPVLRSYYEVVPEGREEMVVDLRLVARREGIALIALATTGHRYLYLSSAGEALFLGNYERGVEDEAVLELFGYRTREEFLAQVAPFSELPPLPVEDGAPELATCAACGVLSGELHIFGCPVELCPWCEGQLSRCNCRFDQLGVDRIDSEEQLEHLADLLEAKGRIAFAEEQNPSYPVAGEDVGPAAADGAERPDRDDGD
jgi:hypothetical protein